MAGVGKVVIKASVPGLEELKKDIEQLEELKNKINSTSLDIMLEVGNNDHDTKR